MPGPFDTTTRYLVETYPTDWLTFLGFDPASLVEVIDANLTTVSAEVDKLLRIRGAGSERLVHVEFQSTYDATIGERLLRYNATLLEDRRLPVASILVLLRPAASGPGTTVHPFSVHRWPSWLELHSTTLQLPSLALLYLATRQTWPYVWLTPDPKLG